MSRVLLLLAFLCAIACGVKSTRVAQIAPAKTEADLYRDEADINYGIAYATYYAALEAFADCTGDRLHGSCHLAKLAYLAAYAEKTRAYSFLGYPSFPEPARACAGWVNSAERGGACYFYLDKYVYMGKLVALLPTCIPSRLRAGQWLCYWRP